MLSFAYSPNLNILKQTWFTPTYLINNELSFRLVKRFLIKSIKFRFAVNINATLSIFESSLNILFSTIRFIFFSFYPFDSSLNKKGNKKTE